MTDLQHIHLNDPAAVEQRLLGRRSGVTRQERAFSIPLEEGDDRLVVDRVHLASRTAGVQHRQSGATPRERSAGGQDLDRHTSRAGGGSEAPEEVGLVVAGRQPQAVDGQLFRHRKETERVVRMRMRREHGV